VASDEFLPDVFGCFMSKFNELLENSPVFYSNDVEHIGRQLLFSHADDAFRKTTCPG
jgi:hypothetical protein